MAVLACILFAGLGCQAEHDQHFSQTREMMGTFVTITVYASSQQKAEAAMDSAFEKIRKIEEVASIFDPQSQASYLNKHGSIQEPSTHLSKLIAESKNYYQVSGGAFDITVQPILELWQEGLWEQPEEIQQQKVDAHMQLVGSDMINMDAAKIAFEKDHMKITLGGIAKGYAVDQAIQVLRQEGINHALVNAGGDIMTTGKKPDGTYWNIALANPDDSEDTIAVFNVDNKAVATSGNYERYFDSDLRAHHILDPRTGYASDQCISTTIISHSCMDADALSTAIFVLGPEEGINLVNRLDGVEAFIIDYERNIFQSDDIANYLEK